MVRKIHHKLSQNLKNLPRTPSGAIIDDLE